MQKLPELRNVASDQQTSGLELHLAVDRDSASRLGITAQTNVSEWDGSCVDYVEVVDQLLRVDHCI